MLVAADSDGALARRIATVRRAVQHAAAPKGSSHPAAKRLLGVLARQVALARGRAAIGAVVATVAARGRLQRTRRRGGRRRDHWHSAAPAPRGQVNSLAVARLAGGGRLQQTLRLSAARASALRAELARRCSRCHRKHGDSRPPRNAHGKGAGLVCLCWWLEKAVGSRAGAAAALPPPAAVPRGSPWRRGGGHYWRRSYRASQALDPPFLHTSPFNGANARSILLLQHIPV